ncbi:hypothetical protein RZS08_52490, partial [Arthrospira platensis SPKY1]|nr:hypothetical protein [Arthrospira platensis SPKY1]
MQNVLFHYPQKVQTPIHDADGNLTHDQYLNYVYDAENRLTKVFGFGFQMEMKYDYRNRRVEQRFSRTVDGTMTEQWTRRFLYDGYQLIAEIN